MSVYGAPDVRHLMQETSRFQSPIEIMDQQKRDAELDCVIGSKYTAVLSPKEMVIARQFASRAEGSTLKAKQQDFQKVFGEYRKYRISLINTSPVPAATQTSSQSNLNPSPENGQLLGLGFSSANPRARTALNQPPVPLVSVGMKAGKLIVQHNGRPQPLASLTADAQIAALTILLRSEHLKLLNPDDLAKVKECKEGLECKGIKLNN